MQRRDFLKAPALAAVPVVGMASEQNTISIVDPGPDIEFKIVPRTVDELRRAIEAEFDDVVKINKAFIEPGDHGNHKRVMPVTIAGGHVKEQGEKIKKFAQTEKQAIQDAWEGFLALKRAYGLEGTLYWRSLPENRNYYAWESLDLGTSTITDRGPWCHAIYMRLWAC